MVDSEETYSNSNTVAVAGEGFLFKDDLVWIAHSINLQEMEAHAQHTFTTTIVKHHKDNDK